MIECLLLSRPKIGLQKKKDKMEKKCKPKLGQSFNNRIYPSVENRAVSLKNAMAE